MADETRAEEPTLKAKREAFVLAYIGEARFNASEAARIAGYAVESAGVEGCRLLKNARVRARIDEHLEAMALGAKEVLAELTDVATAEWRDFVEVLLRDDDGKPIKTRMDLSAKIKSLELLGKHHQLFSDNLNINGGIEIHEFVGIPKDAP
jgi:phage terminase small subunit